AVLRALITEDAGQATGIDIGNADNILGGEVFGEALFTAEVAGKQRQVANHEAGGPDGVTFSIFRIDTGVADMGISQGDDLLRIGRVGQYFLVSGDGGIEHHLTNRQTFSTNCSATKNAAVFKNQ